MDNFDYDVEIDEKNHIIAHLGGQRCLIDTGSPVTLCEKPVEFGTFRGGSKKLGGVDVSTVLASSGWSLDNIRKLSGLDIDALVGTDVLSTQRWFLDPFQKTLTVGFLPKGHVTQVEGLFQGGSPVVEGKINGEAVNLLIDTGANVTFLSRRACKDLPEVGKHKDFYPTTGKFETSLHSAKMELLGADLGEVKVAKLPEVLDFTIGVASTFGGTRMEGIAGMEEILQKGSIGFDLRSGVVVFSPRES